jgi:mediator of RNA polymerase II transcription subunit 6
MTLRYGEEYMDENPITGHPGDFHLSTTGRKGNTLKIPPGPAASKGLTPYSQAKTATETPTPEAAKAADVIPPVRKGSRGDKSPKTPGMPKPKRRKSKGLNSAGGVSPT